MPERLPPSVAIAIATVTTPKPPSCGEGVDRHLIGIALFEAEEGAAGDFVYRLQLRTIPAGASEAVLVDWLTPRLPKGRVAIGWHLTETIVPALLEAADAASPDAARDLIDAIAGTVAIDAVDLADEHGGLGAPPFSNVCATAGIPARAMTEAELLGAWGIGRRIELVGLLATNAVATWRLWAQMERPADAVPQRFAQDVLAHWRVDEDVTLTWRDDRAGE